MVADWFAGRLRELRVEAGLSQVELAEKVGVTVRQISRLETAAQVPTWPTILALADALGITPNDFNVKPKATEATGRGRPRK